MVSQPPLAPGGYRFRDQHTPIPAPFPPALAGIGLSVGILILMFSGRTPIAWCLAALFSLVPIAGLLYQRGSERELQSQLSTRLGGVPFKPRPH